MEEKRLKLVYLTPSLYNAGGVERVLTLKANYFAEQYGYDVTIVLTDGHDKPFFYPLSKKVKVIDLNIGFEQLWSLSFLQKIPVYLKKQREYRKRLTKLLMNLNPDITISLLRREINFLCSIKDGSAKVGELHVNRANYRNFEAGDTNWLKQLFARYWMHSLVKKLKRLDAFVTLTHEDAAAWPELNNIKVIPDPLSFSPQSVNALSAKRVIAVGRYSYQKGFDLLLKAWATIEKDWPDWQLAIFGSGDRSLYEQQMRQLGIDKSRCKLNGSTQDIEKEYLNSSLFAFSSRFEGFGMVLVEAMACGLPVVAFSCPCGPKDIVRNGTDGYLVPQGNVEALAEKLSFAIANLPSRGAEMSHNAIARAQEFNIDLLAQQWQHLFGSLAHHK